MKTLVIGRILGAIAVVGLFACGGGGSGPGTTDEGPQQGPFVVDQDTIALWHFDEGGGQFAQDASSHRYDLHLGPTAGADTEDPYWTSGRFGQCLHYVTSEGDYAMGSHVFSIPSNQASVELWYRTLVTDGYLFNAGFQSFGLAWAGTTHIWFAIGDNSGTDIAALDQSWSPVIADGNWHYLAATYDGTTLRIFLDGQERTSAVGGRGIAAPHELHVGGHPLDTAVAGDVDEVRFSSRARSAAEIAAYWERNRP